MCFITYYIYKTCHYKSQNKLHLQNTSFINHITFTKHFILKSYNSFTKQVIYKSHITFTKKHHLKIPYNMWLKNVFLINHDVYLSLNVVTLESKVISATWSCKDVNQVSDHRLLRASCLSQNSRQLIYLYFTRCTHILFIYFCCPNKSVTLYFIFMNIELNSRICTLKIFRHCTIKFRCYDFQIQAKFHQKFSANSFFVIQWIFYL
jgi:hypothetical protein